MGDQQDFDARWRWAQARQWIAAALIVVALAGSASWIALHRAGAAERCRDAGGEPGMVGKRVETEAGPRLIRTPTCRFTP